MEKIQQISNVKISEFALRHFDPKFGGTKILDVEPKIFETQVNVAMDLFNSKVTPDASQIGLPHIARVIDGYAPFCKLVAVKNHTNARVGCVPITESNFIYIRHGYSSRREGEFEVSSRWLELPVPAPRANFLMLVLYSKEQMDKEAMAEYNKKMAEGGIDSFGLEKPEPFQGDWGIVAILGQHGSEEEPMKPETFDRNYMPIEFGGSGMKYPTMPVEPKRSEFDNDGDDDYESAMRVYKEMVVKYNDKMREIRENRQRSVDFWKTHVTVK